MRPEKKTDSFERQNLQATGRLSQKKHPEEKNETVSLLLEARKKEKKKEPTVGWGKKESRGEMEKREGKAKTGKGKRGGGMGRDREGDRRVGEKMRGRTLT